MVWFGRATAGSFVWNANRDPIKNRVMGMVLALSGQNIKGKHNNQPIVSICGGRESREVVRGGVESIGKHCPIIWDVEWSDTKIIKIQYMVAFIGRQSANQNTTTNKKQATATEGSMKGIFNEQDAWGKRTAIILGAL